MRFRSRAPNQTALQLPRFPPRRRARPNSAVVPTASGTHVPGSGFGSFRLLSTVYCVLCTAHGGCCRLTAQYWALRTLYCALSTLYCVLRLRTAGFRRDGLTAPAAPFLAHHRRTVVRQAIGSKSRASLSSRIARRCSSGLSYAFQHRLRQVECRFQAVVDLEHQRVRHVTDHAPHVRLGDGMQPLAPQC